MSNKNKQRLSLVFQRAKNGRFKISTEALEIMFEYAQIDPDQPEGGGVLVGRHIAGSEDIVVDAVSCPCPDDQRSRTSFERSVSFHQEFIDKAWKDSGGHFVYLGEWHSHPQKIPTPSPTDLSDWSRKLQEDQVDSNSVFFAIVGTRTLQVWEGMRDSGNLYQLEQLGEESGMASGAKGKGQKTTSKADLANRQKKKVSKTKESGTATKKKIGKPKAKVTKPKAKRPVIPQHTILELWSKSGGRCEFRGCNEPLWKDELTLNSVNLSNIAHIVSWTPTGPRGHLTLSKQLEKDISNLMLVCLNHHKNFDTAEYLDRYPREQLLEMKREHEDRIASVTAIESSWKTTVIYAQSYIQGKPVELDRAKIFQAVIPRYPSNSEGIKIDLAPLQRDGGQDFYALAMEYIQARVNEARRIKFRNEPVTHFSVFGLAPIPLMMFLGKCLTDAADVSLFQHHRKTKSWKWPETNEEWSKSILVDEDRNEELKQIVLLLSLSDSINREDVDQFMRENGHDEFVFYELKNEIQTCYFLKIPEQITQFGEEFHATLNRIKSLHGTDAVIHLFSAVPVPIAVKCGQVVLEKKDPTIRVYDYNSQRQGFEFALELHRHESKLI